MKRTALKIYLSLLLILLGIVLLTSTVSAQRMPDYYGLNKIRINGPDRSMTVEVIPVNGNPATETDRNYYWYSGNAIHITQGGYSGRLLNGHYEEFYPNKNLAAQGEFRKGLKAGQWQAWYDSGTLMEVITWKEGLKQGRFVRYDEEGRPKEEGSYKIDLLEGKVRSYHSGDSVETARYRHGQLVKVKLAVKPTLWSRFHWPRRKPAGTEQIKAPKPPKVKKQRKLSTPDITAAP